MNTKWKVLMALVCAFFFVTACTSVTNNEVHSDFDGTEEQGNASNGSNINESIEEGSSRDEQVELLIAYQWGEEGFNNRFKPIEDLLGNVSIEYIPSNGTKEALEEMFATGIYPDIIVDNNIFALQDLEVIHPLDELLQQEGFDLSTLNQSLVHTLRAYDDDGALIGLPDGSSLIGLYINKDIFDMFGESYPDPNEPMTWNEVMDLARSMTAERDGVDYIGLEGAKLNYALRQFAPTATDPDTGEVHINEEEAYTRYLNLIDEYYRIPGIDHDMEPNPFIEGTAAMTVDVNAFLSWWDYDINYYEPFDLVPLPVWPELPNIGPELGTTPMVIANYSEHKEEALDVLTAYYSPDIQLEQIRAGAVVTPVADPDLYRQFAADLDVYDGKNLDAYFVLKHAVAEEKSRWDDHVNIDEAVERVAQGEDVVTVIRELEEESQVIIQEAMQSQGD